MFFLQIVFIFGQYSGFVCEKNSNFDQNTNFIKKKVFLYWKSGTKTIFLKKITKNTE